MIKTDVLVLGSGAAGLTFALEVAERSKFKVLVITKKDRSESNTNYAQGGIAGVMAPFDSFEAHIRDTLVAGAGLCGTAVIVWATAVPPQAAAAMAESSPRVLL